METNDLKDIWKDSFAENEYKLSPEEIEEKLKIKSKTKSLMKKVKRSFHFELITSVVMLILMLIYFLAEVDTAREVAVVTVLVLFMGGLIIFVWNKYRKIRGVKILQDQLKPAIIQWIKILEKYVGFNTSRFTKYIIFPFAILLGFTLGIIISADDADILGKLLENKNGSAFMSIGLLIVFYVLILPFSKWMNKKLYSRHLDEMRQCLKDLEEIDEVE